jgi:diphthamide synthase (EF-2-diphthine--ammonia ligase)
LLGVYFLWGTSGQPTDTLAQSIIDSGVQAVVTCVDPSRIPTSFAGRFFDRSLLADLPPDVDPCGERGEFHTFVFGGPGFSSPIDIEVAEIVERDGFVFCDVRPRFG